MINKYSLTLAELETIELFSVSSEQELEGGKLKEG